ncbi:TonB-dependent receptor [Polymorphobacter multimanifer]|uniref:Iron complex outermembrane receptor protein n=1 Tax=Polymorphobacter multimanifer TaxID=1070431 RepID=A0A841L9K7_9SPHN|nr:TonB-dependent receptor [Polymorphobacter multimanifer]MBB6229224.1 iron complex outermembrane receptor protein [Polymorphobacter multimanifer]GGI80661.1 TonB-dependent receptor [Polymorphobacter multimanifer]
MAAGSLNLRAALYLFAIGGSTIATDPAMAQEASAAKTFEAPPRLPLPMRAGQKPDNAPPLLRPVPTTSGTGRSGENAVTAAEDAFGFTIGREAIGIYSSRQVRGFSPSTAQNLRIEGLYFDNQAFVSQRLVQGSTVRVGFSALGYPFPAPTGIVDFGLRKPGNQRIVSVVGGLADYAAPFVEVDALIPFTEHLGVAAGISAAHEQYFDGANAVYLRAAISPRWQPVEGVEIIPFVSITRGLGEETVPTLVTTGNFAPPEVRRRRYFGPDWASKDSANGTSGLVAKVRVGDNLALAFGGFHSFVALDENFADIFVIGADAGAVERVIADPAQYREAFSGEFRASRSFPDGNRLHIVHASLRARERRNRYGGTAPAIVAAARPLGEKSPLAQPAVHEFGIQNRDRLDQVAGGVAYEGRWKGVGELILGVQRTRFEKRAALASGAESAIEDELWLYNAAIAVTPTERMSFYVGFTRGLEESGIAPDNAANRLEVLPPIRTRQVDLGIRYRLGDSLRFTAGLFDVRKPYFSNDPQNRFRQLGEVRHRGAELSLSGTPVKGLNLIVGAVLMAPRVTGVEVDAGVVGTRPVGQAGTILRGNLDYVLPFAPGWSVNAGVNHSGSRAASRDNMLIVDAYTIVDLGARYQFKLGTSPAQFRLALSNVADTYYFDINGANAFGITDGRRLSAYLSVDL